jgi:ribonuclease E
LETTEGAPIEGAETQAEGPREMGAPPAAEGEAEGDRTGRRRSRRGGRRRRPEGENVLPPLAEPWAEQPDVPAYAGPTPADPFGGENFDIFAVLEQAEQAAEAEVAPGAVAEPAPTPESQPEPQPEPGPVVASAEAAAETALVAAQAQTKTLPVAVEEPAPTPKPQLEPEARAEPAIKPVVIEADAPEAEKKRGWWRR